MLELIELLKIALGKARELDTPFEESQWDAVYSEAKKQALLGVCYKAVESLPDEQKPSKRIKVQWALTVEKIEDRNARMDSYTRKITQKMSALGPKSCIIKGQGVAALYPWPELRQCGDIDIWVDGGHKKIVPLLRENMAVGEIFYHHANVAAFPDGTCVEVHFHPSWMNDPFMNRRLMRWFDSQASAQFGNYFLDKGFSIPTVEFNLVYNMVHIYRHLLSEGVGMRQLMDYYFILNNSNSEERFSAVKVFKSLHMMRFVAAVMYAQQKFFDIDDKFLLCEPDVRTGSLLLQDVSISGNFGYGDDRNASLHSENFFIRGVQKMKRLSRFITIAPLEVLWAPAFKIWQWCWRVKNHYC